MGYSKRSAGKFIGINAYITFKTLSNKKPNFTPQPTEKKRANLAQS